MTVIEFIKILDSTMPISICTFDWHGPYEKTEIPEKFLNRSIEEVIMQSDDDDIGIVVERR